MGHCLWQLLGIGRCPSSLQTAWVFYYWYDDNIVLLFKPGMHHAEHLTTTMQQCERIGGECGTATVWALPLKIMYTECRQNAPDLYSWHAWGLRIACRLGWAKWKNNLFWACGQHTHGEKNPLKNLSEEKIMRGKSHMKSNTREKTRHPMIRDWQRRHRHFWSGQATAYKNHSCMCKGGGGFTIQNFPNTCNLRSGLLNYSKQRNAPYR